MSNPRFLAKMNIFLKVGILVFLLLTCIGALAFFTSVQCGQGLADIDRLFVSLVDTIESIPGRYCLVIGMGFFCHFLMYTLKAQMEINILRASVKERKLLLVQGSEELRAERDQALAEMHGEYQESLAVLRAEYQQHYAAMRAEFLQLRQQVAANAQLSAIATGG